MEVPLYSPLNRFQVVMLNLVHCHISENEKADQPEYAHNREAIWGGDHVSCGMGDGREEEEYHRYSGSKLFCALRWIRFGHGYLDQRSNVGDPLYILPM